MSAREPVGRMILGPIVGHTDDQSTIIWIRVTDNPNKYSLSIKGGSIVPFISTEGDGLEFRTAIATVTGLRSDWEYKYRILRRNRSIANAAGTFRTMPHPGSEAEILFVSVSCHGIGSIGAWPLLLDAIKTAKPRFLLMIGDQLYLDDQSNNVWRKHLHSSSKIRRRVMAEVYQKFWGREPIRSILANIPTYMLICDHEIRNGWGSWATDSPTLANMFPNGKKILDKAEAYFKDALDAYTHFQMSHNPPAVRLKPEFGNRFASPFFFFCGRLAVLFTDSRGARDLWREKNPVLGDNQWEFIEEFLNNLPSEIDALVVVTSTPIVTTSPDGFVNRTLAHRYDDVEFFEEGNESGAFGIQYNESGDWVDAVFAVINSITGSSIGYYHISDLSDVRDQWGHPLCRGEQIRLLRAVAESSLKDRPRSQPRKIMFLGGDVHAGGIFEISISKPALTIECMITSGIAQAVPNSDPLIPTVFDEKFEVAEGINAALQKRTIVQGYNFGVTQVVFTSSTPQITNTVVHGGIAHWWGLKFDVVNNLASLFR